MRGVIGADGAARGAWRGRMERYGGGGVVWGNIPLPKGDRAGFLSWRNLLFEKYKKKISRRRRHSLFLNTSANRHIQIQT